jgi:VanZ family protein
MRTYLVELKKKKKNPCFYIFFFSYLDIFLFIILGIVVDMIWLHRPYFLFFSLSFAPPSSYYWRPLEVFFYYYSSFINLNFNKPPQKKQNKKNTHFFLQFAAPLAA